MADNIDHDRLFKELISTFFVDFIALFFPRILEYLDTNSINFLDKEIFTDVTQGEKYESDLVAQVKFRGEQSFFLVHIEAQSTARSGFNRRMFNYFARFDEKFAFPIYPIVIFSYDSPQKAAVNRYEVSFPDFKVLEFNYQVIQLNRLNWRDFLNQNNPVASALMAKMKIDKLDRPKVKAECLRLLVTLKLDPARMQLISGFVDTYLNLNQAEELQFQSEIREFTQTEQEDMMQITTSWMRQGIERGIEQGIEQGIEGLVLRQLRRKFGVIDNRLEERIRALNVKQLEALGEALLEFTTVDDLEHWFGTKIS